jgi:hypothetical protein
MNLNTTFKWNPKKQNSSNEIKTKLIEWNWKQNSNEIGNEIENKIQTKLLKTKFIKWLWKQKLKPNWKQIQIKLNTKFKWNWKQN